MFLKFGEIPVRIRFRAVFKNSLSYSLSLYCVYFLLLLSISLYRERNIERCSDFYDNLYNNKANYTIQVEVEEGTILDNVIEHMP